MDRKIHKQKVSRKQLVGIGVLCVIAAVFIYNLFFLDTRSHQTIDKSRIFIHEVAEDSFQEFIEVSGTVQPIRSNVLDAVEGGVVKKVYRESGEMVEQGDTLLLLSNSNLQLNVKQQEAGLYDQINNVRNSRLNLEQNHLRLREELANAETRRDVLEPRFRRDSALFEQGLISEQEFEETKQSYKFQKRRYDLNYESYQKDSLQMEHQLEQLDNSEERMWLSLDGVQQILDNLIVTAPISGQLSTVELNQGQAIEQGERLGQIDQLDHFKIRADIDEFYLARVTTGLEGSFSFADERHELIITRVFPVIQDGKFQVDMDFTSSIPNGLRRGQTVRVRLELGDQTEALLLTRGSFYQETGGNWIYKIEENEDRAYKQPIRLGRGNSEYFEVLEGLSAGDKVITSGYDSFNNSDVIVLE